MASSPFREVVFRLTPVDNRELPQLPLFLSRGSPTLLVETRIAQLDARGRVWRILTVFGTPNDLRVAEARFRIYRPPFLVEKSIVGRTRNSLLLWFKYRVDGPRAGLSHTALALRMLGPDTFITDRTQAGRLTIRIVSRGGPALRRFLSRVEKQAKAFRYDLLYSGPMRSTDTPRLAGIELAALTSARRLGFFDVPRRASLRDVGRDLGISASAAGYRLRAAERKLVDNYLAG